MCIIIAEFRCGFLLILAMEDVMDKRRTIDEDGAIRFSVTGLGLTGKQWIERSESKGHDLSVWAKDVLSSPDFVPCEAGKVYNLAILPGVLFSDENRTTVKIRAEGDRRGLFHGKNLPTEIGCLICENFTNEEIKQRGLSLLITMHEPVKDSGSDPFLLGSYRDGVEFWLRADYDKSDYRWPREFGFVFLASQD
ncbi:hypothetical protein L6261_00075 [Candidatus Parcubacteria bacterium]|nr:hypothetical protein [Candidatus Parcubacteria bacterium]